VAFKAFGAANPAMGPARKLHEQPRWRNIPSRLHRHPHPATRARPMTNSAQGRIDVSSVACFEA
jgi:hypothetical protein